MKERMRSDDQRFKFNAHNGHRKASTNLALVNGGDGEDLKARRLGDAPRGDLGDGLKAEAKGAAARELVLAGGGLDPLAGNLLAEIALTAGSRIVRLAVARGQQSILEAVVLAVEQADAANLLLKSRRKEKDGSGQFQND
jgi:hypothetical protein